jgi:hypothetical protein
MKDNQKIKRFSQFNENLNISGVINSKIQETDGLLDRINKLVIFLMSMMNQKFLLVMLWVIFVAILEKMIYQKMK